jgi:seryl-tRNA(Sec) selenium transferase
MISRPILEVTKLVLMASAFGMSLTAAVGTNLNPDHECRIHIDGRHFEKVLNAGAAFALEQMGKPVQQPVEEQFNGQQALTTASSCAIRVAHDIASTVSVSAASVADTFARGQPQRAVQEGPDVVVGQINNFLAGFQLGQ